MPLIPDVPPTGKVPQPDTDQSLNKFHIMDVQLILKPGAPGDTKVRIKWSEGYMDGENYVHVKSRSGMWSGGEDSDLLNAINKVTSGGTLYGELKAAIWEFLQLKGEAPAGVIT